MDQKIKSLIGEHPGTVITFCGVYVSLKNPDPYTIFPFDIAVGLGRECRFGNHTAKMYSVAEHSIWCMQRVEEKYPNLKYLPFKILLHDAHEYIFRDLQSQIKELVPEYKVYADLLQQAIHSRFNVSISPVELEIIKEIDKEALEWEWKNKVLKWSGLLLDEDARIELFIYHFLRLCRTPVVLRP